MSIMAVTTHIACTPELVMTGQGTWSNVLDGARLSDHAGVWVDAEPFAA